LAGPCGAYLLRHGSGLARRAARTAARTRSGEAAPYEAGIPRCPTDRLGGPPLAGAAVVPLPLPLPQVVRNRLPVAAAARVESCTDVYGNVPDR
jgi:hypothetical protein